MLGPLRRAQVNAVPLAIAFSVSLHLALVAAGARLVRQDPATSSSTSDNAPGSATRSSGDDPIDMDMPFFRAVRSPNRSEPSSAGVAERARPGGAEPIARPDTNRRGRGGDNESSQPALNLADRDDKIRLSPEVASRIDRDQIQRLATAAARESWEDARRSREPMQLTFLATGKGDRMERRPPADRDPSSGVEHAPRASVVGTIRIGADPVPPGYGLPVRVPGGAQVGGDTSSPGLGVVGGVVGGMHRSAANVANARPMVRQGSPSVPADVSGRPKDTVDSPQEVATSVQSLVHASTAGGHPGNGVGGTRGPGQTGSGGVQGPGSQASVMGQGAGGYYAPDGLDPRLSMYRRRVMAKLWPLWEDAFPRWAIADLRQGQVIITLVVYADGRVVDPRIKRPSGIPEFDSKCLDAVKRASPFDPLPANLGVSYMQWDISFEASNPVVR